MLRRVTGYEDPVVTLGGLGAKPPGRRGGWAGIFTLMDIEQRVIQVLDRLGAPYEVIPIDPAYADTADFCAQYGFPPDHAGNTIICASKREPKEYCACVVLATTRLDVNHAVRSLMGVTRLSFAGAEETQALTGMAIGGVTVFALPVHLPIYVDELLMSLDYVILGSGSRSSKIKTAPDVLRRVPNVSVVAGLSIEGRPGADTPARTR